MSFYGLLWGVFPAIGIGLSVLSWLTCELGAAFSWIDLVYYWMSVACVAFVFAAVALVAGARYGRSNLPNSDKSQNPVSPPS